MVKFSNFCPQENSCKIAIFTYFIEYSRVRTMMICPSTNTRLSVPLSAWRVGTPSLFFHTQHLKGGVLQNDTKTTDTAERTNCRI